MPVEVHLLGNAITKFKSAGVGTTFGLSIRGRSATEAPVLGLHFWGAPGCPALPSAFSSLTLTKPPKLKIFRQPFRARGTGEAVVGAVYTVFWKEGQELL
eukprot:scaffold11590_cov21-Tisochrysis_lutea.AAC.2